MFNKVGQDDLKATIGYVVRFDLAMYNETIFTRQSQPPV